MEYSAEVIRPAAPAPDRNRERYEEIWRTLPDLKRANLEQDWKIWHLAQQHLNSLKALCAMFPNPSQLKRRLNYTLRPPAGWSVCGYCEGRGDGDIGYCRNCGGDGYVT